MRKEFKFHKLNAEGQKKSVEIAELYSNLADALSSLIFVSSPELTIAIRKLEESCFYAKKAMAQEDKNQEV